MSPIRFGLLGVGWLIAAPASLAASPFEIQRKGEQLEVRLRGRPVMAYAAGPGVVPEGVPGVYQRGGYLHPLVTPGGRTVTGDYPANHLHHHGVWTAWTRTSFDGRAPDFWNMGERKGRVEFAELLGTETRDDAAVIRARHRFVDLTAAEPVTVLEEEWTVRVAATPADRPHVIDLEIVQRNPTPHALDLPRYHYGGLGFRGPDRWDGATNALFLTSEGVRDRVAGNETRGRWCWIGGAVEGGGVAGVALLGHPDNFRAPQPMRLHPAEPFFCFAPQQGGDFAIPAGGEYRARYGW